MWLFPFKQRTVFSATYDFQMKLLRLVKYQYFWYLWVKAHLALALVLHERIAISTEWTTTFYAVKLWNTGTGIELHRRNSLWTRSYWSQKKDVHWSLWGLYLGIFSSDPVMVVGATAKDKALDGIWYCKVLKNMCLPTNSVQTPLVELEQHYPHSFMGLFSYSLGSISLVSLLLA